MLEEGMSWETDYEWFICDEMEEKLVTEKTQKTRKKNRMKERMGGQ